MAKAYKQILIFICVICFLVIGCAQENKDKSQVGERQSSSSNQDDLAQSPDEMLSSFSLSGYAKGGKKQWELEGKSADIGSSDINLKDITGRVYGKKTNMTIVADEGSLNRVNNNVHLEKNVLATSDDGATLTTDYLDWDAQNQKLSSEAPVWLKRGMMHASGTGITAQPALNLVELKKDVTVELFLEAKPTDATEKQDLVQEKQEIQSGLTFPTTVINCDGPLEVEYQKNLAIFQDNVKVKDRRGEILADRMDVYFATATEQGQQLEGMEGMGIDKIVATGNVEIYHGDNTTYSQKAVYDTETGKLILTGQPKLVIYSTEDLKAMLGSSQE